MDRPMTAPERICRSLGRQQAKGASEPRPGFAGMADRPIHGKRWGTLREAISHEGNLNIGGLKSRVMSLMMKLAFLPAQAS